jgi:hypothetical protein
VVDSFAAGEKLELPAVFERIERILAEGDASARELATVGALEDIQNISSHQPFGPQAFEPWLGPRSREAWAEINRLWQAAGGSLMDVIRYEKNSNDEK